MKGLKYLPTPKEFAADMRQIDKELAADPEGKAGAMQQTIVDLLKALGYGAGATVWANAKRY